MSTSRRVDHAGQAAAVVAGALRPVQTGEILVTTLGERDMPLVRYRTGDAACWLPGPCACGSSLWRLGRVPGRIAPNGSIVQPAKGGRTA